MKSTELGYYLRGMGQISKRNRKKRREFAKLMLAAVRERLPQEGMKTPSLNCDRSNKPALKLYQGYNLREKWTQVGYVWMLES